MELCKEKHYWQITVEQKRIQESLFIQKEHVLDFSWCERDAHPRMNMCFFSPLGKMLKLGHLEGYLSLLNYSQKCHFKKKWMFLGMLLITQTALDKMVFLLFKNQKNSLLPLIPEQQNFWAASCSFLSGNPTPHNSSAEACAPEALLNSRRVGIMKSHLRFTANKCCSSNTFSNAFLHCQLRISFLQALTWLVKKTWP